MSSNPVNPHAMVVVQCQLKADRSADFAVLLSRMGEGLAGDPAFVELESHIDAAWREPALMWHFTSVEAAQTWSQSERLAAHLAAIEALSEARPVSNVIVDTASTPSGAATLVVTSRVAKENGPWFAEWQGRMAAAAQQFPGYLGQRVQAPLAGANPDWVTVMAFDSAADLHRWTTSPERTELVQQSAPYVERFDVRPARSAFESWFAKSEEGGSPPPAWKLSSIVLLVLYPIVMLEFFTVNHLTQDDLHLDPAIAVFIGNAISVAITGFLLIPWASRLLNWWLVPPLSEEKRRTRQGAILLLALYALSIVIFIVIIRLFPQVMP